MRDLTLRFINELRTAGLRISISESMDALRAVAAIGVEREMFREALATCLVKEEDDRTCLTRPLPVFLPDLLPNGAGSSTNTGETEAKNNRRKQKE